VKIDVKLPLIKGNQHGNGKENKNITEYKEG
jgi:hypothetical protein